MNKGAYRLIIYLSTDREIEIGALGKFLFKKGWYVYTGSAMNNLQKRVDRHNRKEKTLRWHIDYFLNDSCTEIEETLYYPSDEKNECELNAMLLVEPGVSVPVKGFGSSDCSVCPAHLLYFGKRKPIIK